jgi:uncharacterized protein (DUF486 family)
MGSAVYPPVELKTIKEVITLVVFLLRRASELDVSWRFGLIALDVALVFDGPA